MSVLVTGGAGYIGSHAVNALAARGRDVVVLDNLSAGHLEAVRRIQRAHPGRSIQCIEGDVTNARDVQRALGGVSAVMHFAARLSVAESVREPGGYYHTNVTGALTVLQAMVSTGVPHFIFSSTAATFGTPDLMLIDEDVPQRPINPYGETKLAVERALPHFERATSLRSMTFRYFNAAGAHEDGWLGEDHQPEEHLVPRALRAAAGGEPLVVHGDDYPTPDGTCIRDFVHVSDLADAHLAALAALEAGAASDAYNLGNGQGISVKEVLDTVARVTGRSVPHTMGSRRAGDPARLVASSARARRELGWAPRLGAIDEIVRTAWRWHQSYPDGYRGGADER